MEDKEPTILCRTCLKMPECLQRGIFDQETCDQYQPLSLDELVEHDAFSDSVMVGTCPKCGNENTCEDDNPLDILITDPTVGHCRDCGVYWCLECGFVFRLVERGTKCPHWWICAKCSGEMGYMNEVEFIEEICPTCEHYDHGCRLEDPSECDKESQYTCPYEGNVSECPKIEGFLQEKR